MNFSEFNSFSNNCLLGNFDPDILYSAMGARLDNSLIIMNSTFLTVKGSVW